MKNLPFIALSILFSLSALAQEIPPRPTGGAQIKNEKPTQPTGRIRKTTTTEQNKDDTRPKKSVINGYDAIQIGEQVWMQKNLDVDHFQNGDNIPEAKTLEEWIEACKSEQPVWCYYGFKKKSKYGKLYNWYAVNDPRGLAPKGWEIPGNEEWDELVQYLGGYEEANIKMQSKSGWLKEVYETELYNPNGTNSSGFCAFPVGELYSSSQNMTILNFVGSGYWTKWWSSTVVDDEMVYGVDLRYNSVEITKDNFKPCGFSVRCVNN